MRVTSFLLTLLGMTLTMSLAKRFEPYCGPRTKDIRFCREDDDCRYSDEECRHR